MLTGFQVKQSVEGEANLSFASSCLLEIASWLARDAHVHPPTSTETPSRLDLSF